jgi:hypothetical protein
VDEARMRGAGALRGLRWHLIDPPLSRFTLKTNMSYRIWAVDLSADGTGPCPCAGTALLPVVTGKRGLIDGLCAVLPGDTRAPLGERPGAGVLRLAQETMCVERLGPPDHRRSVRYEPARGLAVSSGAVGSGAARPEAPRMLCID